jgi:hypothetical protein
VPALHRNHADIASTLKSLHEAGSIRSTTAKVGGRMRAAFATVESTRRSTRRAPSEEHPT